MTGSVLLDKAYSLIHDTRICDGWATTVLPDNNHAHKDISARQARINVIIMSRFTAREIMMADRGRYVVLGADKTQCDMIFDIRIAYDDSMRLGEMAVAEAIFR